MVMDTVENNHFWFIAKESFGCSITENTRQ